MQLQFFVQILKQMTILLQDFDSTSKRSDSSWKDFGSYGLQNVLVVPAHQNKAVSKNPHVYLVHTYLVCVYICVVCVYK